MSHDPTVPALPAVSMSLREDAVPAWTLAPFGLLPVGACPCSGATVCRDCLPSWRCDWDVFVHDAPPADAPRVPRFVVLPDHDGYLAVADLAACSVLVTDLRSGEAVALAALLNQPREDGAATALPPVAPCLF